MIDFKMYVITHKYTKKPDIEGYQALLVGAYDKEYAVDFELIDSTGDNISEKNKNFCELTGCYWIWKNIKADVVGICHYRRFFSTALVSKNVQRFVKKRNIESWMKRYDVIMPNKRYRTSTVIEACEESSKRDWKNTAPNLDDLIEMGKAVKRISPEYFTDYWNFINGKEEYLYNMCIMRKEIFDQYCEWLFAILFYIEQDYDISNESAYRQRLFGFLSERLMMVWLKHNVPSEKVKEVRVVKTDESCFQLLKHEARNQLRRIGI